MGCRVDTVGCRVSHPGELSWTGRGRKKEGKCEGKKKWGSSSSSSSSCWDSDSWLVALLVAWLGSSVGAQSSSSGWGQVVTRS